MFASRGRRMAVLFASRGRRMAVSFVSRGRRVAVSFVSCVSRLRVACSLGARWVRCCSEGCAVMAREGRAGSGIDRSPSAPQVRMVGFLAMSLAQVTRGVPLWPRRVGPAQVLTGRPPPLRYVVGFSAPWFYCVWRVRLPNRGCAGMAREGQIGCSAARRPPPPRCVLLSRALCWVARAA